MGAIMSRSFRAAAGAAFVFTFAGHVAAADLGVGPTPVFVAVDGLNYKIEAFGGSSDNRVAGGRHNSSWDVGLAGAVAIPLGQSFGLQVDVSAASGEGQFSGGGAAHLFWRNPQVALAGLYGSYTRRDLDGVQQARLGVEGQYYLRNFTLGGVAGFERTWSDTTIAFIPFFGPFLSGGQKNRGFIAADASWYATDNFKLSLGYRFFGGRSAAAAGAEYMVRTGTATSYSFFAEARAGEDKYLAGLAGVRVYFGTKDKTLIRRHREDDPPNYLPESGLGARSTTDACNERKFSTRVAGSKPVGIALGPRGCRGTV
jgi:hypothetical protein